MPKCLLQVAFDRADRTYGMGETVTGRVDVTVREDCTCRELSVTPQWHTDGKGKDESGKLESLILFTGNWQAGERASYPFRFTVSGGPVSHQGVLFGIHWSAHARADIAVARDAEDDGRFELKPGDVAPEPALEEPIFGIFERSVWQLHPLFSSLVSLVLVPIGLYFIWRLFRGPESGLVILGFLGALICLPIGLVLLWSAIRHAMLAVDPGHVEAEVEPRRLRPGDTITCRVCVRARREIKLEAAMLRLTAKEQVKGVEEVTSPAAGVLGAIASIALSSGGPDVHDGKTVSETICMAAVDLVPAPATRGTGEAIFQASLRIPPNAPPSIRAKSKRRDWKATVQLKKSNWPDWEQDFPLWVSP